MLSVPASGVKVRGYGRPARFPAPCGSASFPGVKRISPSQAPERMDRPDCDPDDLRRALDGLARIQRTSGGHRMVVEPVLRGLAGRPPGPIRLLDVGAGGGELAADLGRLLRARGWSPRTVLADLHPRTIRIARERWPTRPEPALPADFLRLDAPRLPFPDGAFGVAVCANTLHHLEREAALGFLRELERVAAGRWVVVDVRRSRLALSAVRLLAATLWRDNPFPRRDGPVSVRRAFTPAELRTLLAAGGLGAARVEGRWPVRLRVVGGRLAGRR